MSGPTCLTHPASYFKTEASGIPEVIGYGEAQGRRDVCLAATVSWRLLDHVRLARMSNPMRGK
jgi:hypothetical protein